MMTEDHAFSPPQEDKVLENSDIAEQRERLPKNLLAVGIVFLLYGFALTYQWLERGLDYGFDAKNVGWFGPIFMLLGRGLIKGQEFARVWSARLCILGLILTAYIAWVLFNGIPAERMVVGVIMRLCLLLGIPAIIMGLSLLVLNSDRVMNYTYER